MLSIAPSRPVRALIFLPDYEIKAGYVTGFSMPAGDREAGRQSD